MGVLAKTALAVTVLWPGLVYAQSDPMYESITDRDYAIDLHQSTVLGSVRIVGMAGAATALAQGSVGMLANPAAAAVRPPTSSGQGDDKWDWDWHIDWLAPALGTDFDNTGMAATEEFVVAPLITGGAVVQYKQWAVGVSADLFQRQLQVDGGSVDPQFTVGRLVVARSYPWLTIGLGVRTGSLTVGHTEVTDTQEGPVAVTTNLFEITGASMEAGAIWHPRDRDVRVGVSASLPVTGREVKTQGCDPLDCQGLILPREVQLPWRVAVGAAFRIAPTRWNRSVTGPWRDERYVLLSADVIVQGPVENGHSIQGFIRQVLQPSGRSATTSVRAGAEYEWLPGRLRVRGGSYWEPSRIPRISGRPHLTLGMDVRVYSFCLLGDHYRARLSVTGDVAERYGNTGVSVGLWH